MGLSQNKVPRICILHITFFSLDGQRKGYTVYRYTPFSNSPKLDVYSWWYHVIHDLPIFISHPVPQSSPSPPALGGSPLHRPKASPPESSHGLPSAADGPGIDDSCVKCLTINWGWWGWATFMKNIVKSLWIVKSVRIIITGWKIRVRCEFANVLPIFRTLNPETTRRTKIMITRQRKSNINSLNIIIRVNLGDTINGHQDQVSEWCCPSKMRQQSLIATRHKPNPRKKIKQNKVAIVSTLAMTKPHPTLLTVLSTNTLKKLNTFKTSQKQEKKTKVFSTHPKKYVC